MASVRKRGNSYQITVSVGRDMYGKKIVETATFTPDPGTGKREEKQALNQFANFRVIVYDKNLCGLLLHMFPSVFHKISDRPDTVFAIAWYRMLPGNFLLFIIHEFYRL